jgi:choline monooxygenase
LQQAIVLPSETFHKRPMHDLQSTLPAAWYYLPEIYERERKNIFSKSWLYAAHAYQLEHKGDYVTLEIAGFPLLLLRDHEGVLRGFYNICRHRGAPLLGKSCGHVEGNAIACRYHGWAYDLQGQFVSAPHLGKRAGCAELGLLPIALATFEAFIFVNLDMQAPPFAQSMQGLLHDIHKSQYAFSDYTFHTQVVREGAFNWKTWVDGYQECYHCPTIHPIFNKDFVLKRYHVENKQGYAVHSCERKVPSKSGAAEGLWLWVYPNLGMPCYEPCYYTLQVIPLSPARTRLIYTMHFKEALHTQSVREFLNFVDQITEEDVAICERVQSNLQSGVLHSGFLHPERENGVIYFHELVKKALEL